MLGPERKLRSAPEFPALSSQFGEPDAERARTPRLSVAPSLQTEPGSPSVEPADEKDTAKQALAANLEGMIEGMLRNTHFATSAATKTRGWVHQIGEAAALDASTDSSAFTANSLIADLAQARPANESAPAPSSAPRRWWIDAVLALACLLSVASAGYFTFAS